MSSQRTSFPHKSRYPKPGLGFALLRTIGWIFKVTGWLLIGVAVVGFVIMLIRVGPELVRALENSSEGKFAGFVFLLLLTYLLIFPLLGLVGAILTGIGFLFGRWGTNQAAEETSAEPISDDRIQAQEPDSG